MYKNCRSPAVPLPPRAGDVKGIVLDPEGPIPRFGLDVGNEEEPDVSASCLACFGCFTGKDNSL